MADILKYICNVRDVNHKYQEIHNNIFSQSVSKLVTGIFTDKRVAFKKYEDVLKMLNVQLMDIQTALNVLPQSELNIRRGKEILLALSSYITALSISINYLQKICNEKNSFSDSDGNLVNYKMLYDGSFQHHKHLGVKLNELLSSY